MHATIRPYTALRHRLIKKCVYGVTIVALVWVLPAMFIILILRNRMFNQSPIFSTSSGPSVFSWNSCSKKHILSRDFYSSKKLKIHGWMYHSSQFFKVFSLLTSLIEVGNGIFTFHLYSHIWSSFAKKKLKVEPLLFSSPPFLISSVALSFSPFLFLRYCDFGDRSRA